MQVHSFGQMIFEDVECKVCKLESEQDQASKPNEKKHKREWKMQKKRDLLKRKTLIGRETSTFGRSGVRKKVMG